MTDDLGDLTRRIEALESALAQARSRAEQLEALAHEDALTGVLNRRGFEREVERAVAYSRRHDTPIALVMFDLDAFKAINDTHGHAAGDAVLVAAADVLRTNTRASDSVARIGGDEFAVILWQIEAEMAETKARALVEKFAQTPVKLGTMSIMVRMSYGVAMLGGARDFPDAYARADRALYDRKAGQRRVAAK